MNEPLTVEQICNVARAVTQQPWKYLYGQVILDGDSELSYWEPGKNIWQREALTRTVAEMIEEKKAIIHRDFDEYSDRGIYWVQELQARLCSALATNNVPEIERMAWELLEGSDG